MLAIAVIALALAMMLFLDGWLVPFVFLVSHRHDDPHQSRDELLLR